MIPYYLAFDAQQTGGLDAFPISVSRNTITLLGDITCTPWDPLTTLPQGVVLVVTYSQSNSTLFPPYSVDNDCSIDATSAIAAHTIGAGESGTVFFALGVDVSGIKKDRKWYWNGASIVDSGWVNSALLFYPAINSVDIVTGLGTSVAFNNGSTSNGLKCSIALYEQATEADVLALVDATPYHGWTGIPNYGTLDLGIGPTEYDITTRRAIEWAQLPGGGWTGYDDGYTRDTYETRMVVRLDPSQAAQLASVAQYGPNAYDGAVTYYAPSLVLPFGPTVDCTGGVSVRIMSVETIGQPDARTQLWDYSVVMRLITKPVPVAGSLAYFFAHGRAFPEADSAAVRKAAEGGVAVQMARPGGPVSCMWSCGGLTTDEAVAIHNHIVLTWRNGTQTWTPPSGLTPFGPGLLGPFAVRCVEFTWLHEALQSWRVEARLAL